MYKYIVGFALSSTLQAACIDPNQIVGFSNPLLTRKCAVIEQVELMRGAKVQYSTVYFGDSLIANGAFQGNMGVGGDTTQLLMQRADIVFNSHPNDVYILVGINDFARGATAARTLTLYTGLINMLKPAGFNIHVISTIKCNVSLKPECATYNPKIDALNTGLQALPDIDFIDVNPSLTNSGGLLPAYTTDGIHLNSAGYAVMYTLTGQ